MAAVYVVEGGRRLISVGQRTFAGDSVEVVHQARLLLSTLIVSQGGQRAVARRLELNSVPELILGPDPWYEGEPWGAWYPLDLLASLSRRSAGELLSNPSNTVDPADFVEKRWR